MRRKVGEVLVERKQGVNGEGGFPGAVDTRGVREIRGAGGTPRERGSWAKEEEGAEMGGGGRWVLVQVSPREEGEQADHGCGRDRGGGGAPTGT